MNLQENFPGRKELVDMKKIVKGLMMVAMLFVAIIGINKIDSQAKVVNKTVASAVEGEKCTIYDIQNCLDEALQNPSDQYVIKVPKGVYYLRGSERLHISSNTTLILKGVTFRRTKSSGVGAMIQVGYPRNEAGKSASAGGGYTKGGYTRAHDIKIIGGTFNAGKEVKNVSTLCTFSHVKNITIQDTTFCYKPKRKNPAHMIEFGASKNVTIKNCRFLGNRKMGEAVQIESAVKNIAGSDLMGKEDGTKTLNVRLSGCRFVDFEYAFGTNHGCSKDIYKKISICNNSFEKISKYAICTYNYSKAVIKGNVIKKSGKRTFASFILKLGQKNSLIQSKNKVR